MDMENNEKAIQQVIDDIGVDRMQAIRHLRQRRMILEDIEQRNRKNVVRTIANWKIRVSDRG